MSSTGSSRPEASGVTQGISRLERWQDKTAAEIRAAPAAMRSSAAEQALAATDAAMIASRSARDRLDRWRQTQQSRIGMVATVGAAAIVGLFGLMALPNLERATTMAFGTAALIAAVFAGLALTYEAWPKQRASEDIAAAIAGDVAVADHARLVAQLAASLDERPSTSAAALVSRLVAEVEQAASLARSREARVRGETDLRARRHERLVPRQTRTTLITPDNRNLHARIVDVSLSGVAVDGNFPGCAVGSRIRVGSRAARVVRVLPRGLACEFTELLTPGMLTTDIVL